MSSLLRTARDGLIYGAIRGAIGTFTVGDPDTTLAFARRAGRAFAGAPFNRKRLQRAVDNLSEAFPDWAEQRKREFAIRGYEHLCMLGVEIALAGRLLSHDSWADRATVHNLGGALRRLTAGGPVILVTGHVGNWEMTGLLLALLGFKVHALYRPLDLQPMDAWVRRTRSRRGLFLVDKFGATRQLPEVLARAEHAGFVADQNAGVRGLFVPFCGRLASTYKAIGLMATRFKAPVVVGWAQRTGDVAPHPHARAHAAAGLEPTPRALHFDMRIEDTFGPEDYLSRPDPLFYITARYRRALEQAVRHAPEQTLWMHRFWKSRPKHEVEGKPFPALLERKLRELPWMTEQQLEHIKARSARDAAELAAAGSKARTDAAAEDAAQDTGAL